MHLNWRKHGFNVLKYVLMLMSVILVCTGRRIFKENEMEDTTLSYRFISLHILFSCLIWVWYQTMFLEALQLGRTYVQLRICLRPWVIYTRVNTGYDSNKYGINTRARKFKISVQKFSYFEAHLKSPWPPTAWSDQLLVWGFKRNLSYVLDYNTSLSMLGW